MYVYIIPFCGRRLPDSRISSVQKGFFGVICYSRAAQKNSCISPPGFAAAVSVADGISIIL